MAIPADLLSFLKSHGSCNADAASQEYVLSAYLDDAESHPSRRHLSRDRLRHFIRSERQHILEHAPETLDDFERALTVLEARLPDLHAEVKAEHAAVPGWMLLCSPDGEVIEARLAVAPEPSFTWSRCAMVVPFLAASVSDDAIVVLIDLEHATIARMQRGAIHEIDSFTADDTGDAHERLLATTRRKLSVIAGGSAPVVIGGAAPSVAHFAATMPAELSARCVVADGLQVHTPFAVMPPVVHHAILDLIGRRQCEALATLERRAHLTRRAAFSDEMIASAARAGAIERLLVTFTRWHEDPLAVEALCHRALRGGAVIDVATPACADVLDARGGMAAELRFAVPSESSGTLASV